MIFVWWFLVAWIVAVSLVAKEAYTNWDFMDLPGCCSTRRLAGNEEKEEQIPRFGGTPNQSQVWSLNGCGCGKFFH